MSRLTAALNARRESRAAEQAIPQAPQSGMDRAVRAPLFTVTRLVVPLALVAGLLLLIAGYNRYGSQAVVRVNSSLVTTSEVVETTYHDYIPVIGYVVPGNAVYLDAIVGGQVTSVHVEEGALVKAGQPLVTLKNTNLQLEVIGREAQLAEQVNSLSMTQLSFEQNRLNTTRELIQVNHRIEQIERQLQRYRKLQLSGSITQEQLEELEADYKLQKNVKAAIKESQRVDRGFQTKQMKHLEDSINKMEKNIAIARSSLDDLTLRSPIDGQVTVLSAFLGESKAQGQRIGQIDEVNSFKVSALIDEFYLSRVKIGQRAYLTLDGVGHELEVNKVYPNIKDRQFEVELSFDRLPRGVRRGQTMRLNLEIGEPSTSLTVANGPFYDSSGGQWVFVVDTRNRTANRREVKFGRRNPDRIEILSGLHKGETIITSSVAALNGAERLILDDN